MATLLCLTGVLRVVQREWGQQFKDKGKVVDWPKHCFEHFIIVVSRWHSNMFSKHFWSLGPVMLPKPLAS